MRFVVFVQFTPESEKTKVPTAEKLLTMGRFNDELVKDGVMLDADGLQASSKGARIRFSKGNSSVTDGPFTESKEIVAGFWIVQGKSKAEIVERFRHAPMDDGDVLEIRQMFEDEDLAAILNSEAQAVKG
jgi:hypothetical protein